MKQFVYIRIKFSNIIGEMNTKLRIFQFISFRKYTRLFSKHDIPLCFHKQNFSANGATDVETLLKFVPVTGMFHSGNFCCEGHPLIHGQRCDYLQLIAVSNAQPTVG